jgi:probable rRNA maturation factor
LDRGVEFEDEIALMVTHGILHLLGYDHIEDGDAERMEARERQILTKAGRTRR